jgi:retron-type reverse transcriptase
MAARISTLFHHLELNADRQYGFRPGGSTTNAIVQLREIAGQMSDKKYVFAIALDISGAVDNVWWPNVVHEVKRRVCPDNLCRLTRSYFT